MRLLRETFLFGVAGTLGFFVDTGVLYLAKASLGLFGARAVSFVAAVFATWLFNRSLTFRHRRSGMGAHKEFVAYLLLMGAGGAMNYGVYAWLIVSYAIVAQNPILGVAAGSIAGMFLNFLSSKTLLFRRRVRPLD